MKFKSIFVVLAVAGIIGNLGGCAFAQLKTNPDEYKVIRPYGVKEPTATVILAHGCDGFSYSKGYGYRRRANAIAQTDNYNVVLYDAFTPRGWKYDEVCTGDRGAGANAVPPYLRIEDAKQIAQWIQQQPWHKGKISFIGYSHGGSVAMALANDEEASKLISSAVAYYPNCDEGYIRHSTGRPLIPTMVHMGEADVWTPPAACLRYKDRPNYEMFLYKDATHAWDAQSNFTAIGRWQIRYNMDAEALAEKRTNEFFKRTLN